MGFFLDKLHNFWTFLNLILVHVFSCIHPENFEICTFILCNTTFLEPRPQNDYLPLSFLGIKMILEIIKSIFIDQAKLLEHGFYFVPP